MRQILRAFTPKLKIIVGCAADNERWGQAAPRPRPLGVPRTPAAAMPQMRSPAPANSKWNERDDATKTPADGAVPRFYKGAEGGAGNWRNKGTPLLLGL